MVNQLFSLSGKTVLVTGASSGIGRAIAIACSEMGARVMLTARNSENLEFTKSMMCGEGHIICPADITNEAEIQQMAESAPTLDGVVHNAGMRRLMPCKGAKDSHITEMLRTNFVCSALLQKHLLRAKKINRGSSVVFIASRAASAPAIGNAFYAASKGALLAYAKTLGLELSPQGIRVNSICPAMVWTELAERDAKFAGTNQEELLRRYPLKRLGKPEDVANLAVFLLSDASSWMTGSVIDITGGGELTLM